MALARLGQSVQIVDEQTFVPAWRSTPMRAAQRLLRPLAVRELTAYTKHVARWFKPHCLLVFKGRYVQPEVLRYYRSLGINTVNYYPDNSVLDSGPNIPRCLPLYDHVFTTKSFGVEDMRRELGIVRSSYVEHGFDPEIHHPMTLSDAERQRLGCDVAFVGTWRPRKEAIAAALRRRLPGVSLKIWGEQWEKATAPQIRECIMGGGILGREYSKAIQGAKIALGLLSEQGTGAGCGDQTTARTFQIPACGAFMLHERTADAVRHYEEGSEAEFFGSADELVAKVEHYLMHDADRQRIARRGHERATAYSADARMSTILQWLEAQPLPPW